MPVDCAEEWGRKGSKENRKERKTDGDRWRRTDLRYNETGLEGLEQTFTQAELLKTAFLQVFFGITLVMCYVFCLFQCSSLLHCLLNHLLALVKLSCCKIVDGN